MEKKTGILNTFIRYGKLLFVFLKMSLMAQLEYRINFAAGVLVETGWLLIKLCMWRWFTGQASKSES